MAYKHFFHCTSTTTAVPAEVPEKLTYDTGVAKLPIQGAVSRNRKKI